MTQKKKIRGAKKRVTPLTAVYKKHPYQGKAFIRRFMRERSMLGELDTTRRLSDYTYMRDSDGEFDITVENHSAIMKSALRHARKTCKRAFKKSKRR